MHRLWLKEGQLNSWWESLQRIATCFENIFLIYIYIYIYYITFFWGGKQMKISRCFWSVFSGLVSHVDLHPGLFRGLGMVQRPVAVDAHPKRQKERVGKKALHMLFKKKKRSKRMAKKIRMGTVQSFCLVFASFLLSSLKWVPMSTRTRHWHRESEV